MSTQTPKPRPRAQAARRNAPPQNQRRKLGLLVAGGLVVAVALLFLVFRSSGGSGTTGAAAYQVGQPAAGAAAPPVVLRSTAGGTFDLASQRGKTVLLYFQEGVGCQPCWDQIRDIERNKAKFTALGIDSVVSITGNALDEVKQKASDERLSTPVLSDPELAVSKTYHANDYGMMGKGADGHSFVLVGPDGVIKWRGDYGGAPHYTMYVAVDALVKDITAGTRR